MCIPHLLNSTRTVSPSWIEVLSEEESFFFSFSFYIPWTYYSKQNKQSKIFVEDLYMPMITELKCEIKINK